MRETPRQVGKPRGLGPGAGTCGSDLGVAQPVAVARAQAFDDLAHDEPRLFFAQSRPRPGRVPSNASSAANASCRRRAGFACRTPACPSSAPARSRRGRAAGPCTGWQVARSHGRSRRSARSIARGGSPFECRAGFHLSWQWLLRWAGVRHVAELQGPSPSARRRRCRLSSFASPVQRFRQGFIRIMRRGCAGELTACGRIDAAIDRHQQPTRPLSQNAHGLSSDIQTEEKGMRMLRRDPKGGIRAAAA